MSSRALTPRLFSTGIVCPRALWLHAQTEAVDQNRAPHAVQTVRPPPPPSALIDHKAVTQAAIPLFQANAAHVFDFSKKDVGLAASETVMLVSELQRQDTASESVFLAGACFQDSANGLETRVDGISWEQGLQGKAHLYLVKTFSNLDTPRREEAIRRAKFHRFVLRSANIEVGQVTLVYVNRKYVLGLDAVVSQKDALTTVDLTTDVLVPSGTPQDAMDRSSVRLRDVLVAPQPPPMDVGKHCTELGCPFAQAHCIPEEAMAMKNSIFTMPQLTLEKKMNLWRQGTKSAADALFCDAIQLSRTQQMYAEAVHAEQPIVDTAALSIFFKGLTFPVASLDFEAAGFPIPVFSGTKPYQHIPFQFSIHVCNTALSRNPDAHVEYLHYGRDVDPKQDPRLPLAKALCAALGDGDGTILAHNSPYEERIIHGLISFVCSSRDAELQGDAGTALKEKLHEQLSSIADRLVDTLELFRSGAYVHPDFLGSNSLKRIVPVLAPTLQYTGKDEDGVGAGDDASFKYKQFVLARDELSDDAVAVTEQQLKDYCRTDSLALFHVLAAMQESV